MGSTAEVKTGESVATEREYAIRAVERTLEASATLRRHLRLTERVGARTIEALHRLVPVSQSVESAGASQADLLKDYHAIFHRYELCRHEMRAAFILPSLDEGMSIGDIGRALGVSRQLASRLVGEAKASATARAGA